MVGMSILKAELLASSMEWINRVPVRLTPIPDVVNDALVVDPPTDQDNEDFIEAMMMLKNPNSI